MPSYRITIEAQSLPELVGAVTEAASLLQSGDARQAMVAEVAQLAAPFPDAIAGTPLDLAPVGLPTPAPDYVAAGLTEHQQMRVRQAQSEPAAPMVQAMVPAAMAGMHPMTQVQAATAPAAYQPAQTIAAAQAEATQVPFCPIHMLQMVWKGGAISKSGKQLPLWSCPEKTCREAIWADRQ